MNEPQSEHEDQWGQIQHPDLNRVAFQRADQEVNPFPAEACKMLGPGEKGSVPENWDVKIETVSDFDLMQAGIGDRNNGFWGNSHEGNGQTHVVAFDVPDAPLTSIAALQHCQTGANGWDVSYAIGNSLPHPRVPLDQLYEQAGTATSYKTTYYDMSYLANQGLWDSYYFSGIQIPDGSSGMMQSVENVMTPFGL